MTNPARRQLARLLLSSTVALAAANTPPPPVSVVVRIVNGPWESMEYAISHNRLTVTRYPAIRAADHTPQQLLQAPLPHDTASQRLAALDPATYHGVANELLDGGSVLVVDLLKGPAKQSVRYQAGMYANLDETTSFLLTYINQHVPPKLAISATWLKPTRPLQQPNGRPRD